MRKNVVIAFLTTISMFSIGYGITQKQRADKLEAMSLTQKEMAQEAFKKAQEQRTKAINKQQNAIGVQESAEKQETD